MKKIYSLLFFFSNYFAAGSQEFLIPAGQTRILKLSEQTLKLKKLEIGDQATLIIPDSLDSWIVSAEETILGNNVKIIGNGTKGNHGINARYNSGIAGQKGGHGKPGKNIELTLNQLLIGSLIIEANGGNGGDGGSGSKGTDGRNASCQMGAGNGGKGGNGGDGGSGAQGGFVTIKYRLQSGGILEKEKIIIQNSGGRQGFGGSPGSGGLPGMGATCPNTNRDMPAGLYGESGWAGKNGIKGKDGRIIFTPY